MPATSRIDGVGQPRRIKAQSLMAYMAHDYQNRRDAADELTGLNPEIGLP